MIATIVRKELTEMWREGRFRVASVIVLTLMVVALGLGLKQARDANRERAMADRADRMEWLGQGARNPHSAAHFGRFAFKPSSALAFLDRGINTYTGIAVWMEAHSQDAFRFRPAEDATALQRFGELTAAIALQLLIPLVIILLAFDKFAGEREQGSLRQLMSLGIRARDLAAGKALGVAGALALLLTPVTVLGVAALSIASSDDGDLTSGFVRLSLLALAYLLYFGSVLGVAIAVSAWARSGRVALLCLLAFWVVSCLIVPRASADIAERLHPTPSYTEFWTNINRDTREGINGHDSTDARREKLLQETLAGYGVKKVDELPINFDGVALQAGEEYGNQVFDKHYGALWQRFGQQNRVQDLSGVLSPLASVRAVSMGLAGTDFALHKDFASAAESYRRAMVKQMNDEFRDHAGSENFNYKASAETWDKVPDFTYAAPGTVWILANHRVSIGLLVGWFLFAWALATIAVKRIHVT